MSPSFLRRALTGIACVLLVSFAHADDIGDIHTLFRSGKTAEAFSKLDTLLAAHPKDPNLRFLRGVMLADSQHRDEAMQVYRQLNVDRPELPEPYNNLAVLYAAQGDYEQARTALEGALRAQPGFALALANLGDVHLQLARQAYARAQQLDPSNAALAPKLAALQNLVARRAMP